MNQFVKDYVDSVTIWMGYKKGVALLPKRPSQASTVSVKRYRLHFQFVSHEHYYINNNLPIGATKTYK